ncbi:Retrovirus-related Pol polyprotein from transposon opus [Sesamum alatum]|uniref:Retrovirus-related Pol polyprotein from transposon opus n=1 Tax=Sesamum alatum TaxID=300844 RepID=A0AAE1Y1S2_9LAMI|nr:Retrovirus-related Pol polyprotein from transposon opus [Sesamum alatum]
MVERSLCMREARGLIPRISSRILCILNFCVSSVAYLGHIISAAGVEADPSKLATIIDWPLPRSQSELHGFLGLTRYYRRFVCHYVSIFAPLTDLLKSTTLNWSSAALAAFQELKAAMSTLPVLTPPDFSQPFDVTTDASLVAVVAVFS